jgi:hypothetical protein
MYQLLQRLCKLPDAPEIIATHRLPQVTHLGLDAAAIGLGHALAQLSERLLHLIDQGIGLILRLDHLPPATVLLCMPLGFLDQPFDVLLDLIRRANGC